MKKRKEQRMRNINLMAAGLFSIMVFLVLAGIGANPFVGLFVASLFMALPYAKLPVGILGTGTAGAGEDDPKAVIAQFTEKYKTVEQKINDMVTKKELEALQKELGEIKGVVTKEQYEALNTKYSELFEALKTQGEDITKLSKGGKKEEGFKTISEALYAGFAEKKAEIDDIIKNGQKASLHVNVSVLKDAVVHQTDNTIGAGSTQYSLTQNTGKISAIRKRELRYLAHVSTGNIGSQHALWIEESDQQGTPIMLGEGDAKTMLSSIWTEKTQQVKKCAVYGKVTTEMLADLPQLIAYIQNSLMKRLDIKAEDELFTGSGIGDELKGFDAFATAFAAPATLANLVENANELDVIEAIALQVKLAHGEPNALYVNPSTMSAIRLIKDEAGRPVWKDYVTIDGQLKISGMIIEETTAVDAGDFKGGDCTVVNVLNRSEMGITIGLDGNDFTQNKKTMLLEKRWVQFVSANDTAVIIKGDFTTAIAALLKPDAAA